jgi:hypothetical protein
LALGTVEVIVLAIIEKGRGVARSYKPFLFWPLTLPSLSWRCVVFAPPCFGLIYRDLLEPLLDQTGQRPEDFTSYGKIGGFPLGGGGRVCGMPVQILSWRAG